MLKQRARAVALAVFLADVLLIVVAFYATFLIRDLLLLPRLGHMARPGSHLALLYVALPVWVILLYALGLYASQRTKPITNEILRLGAVCVVGTLILMAEIFITKAVFVSRVFVGLFGLAAFSLLLLGRCVLRLVARSARAHGYNFRHIIVVGTGSRAREIVDVIEQNKQWGLRLIGMISDNIDNRMTHVGHIPVLGDVSHLPQLLKTLIVDELLFAVSRKKLEGMEGLFLLCEAQGIRTRVAINFFPHMIAKVHLDNMHGIPLLTFTTTPYSEIHLMVKRAFDVIVASLLLIALSPGLIALCFALWCTSGRPIFFRQTRVGLNGRPFTLYKFRSMSKGAEQMKEGLTHLNEMRGPAFKMREDPRVTAIGRFLRKKSLDELPQLYNVLRGSMSLVGPRPPLPEEVAQYEHWQRRRLSMKPGLTCLWQVYGRNAITDFKQWMEMDLRYIDNWSLHLDLKICIKTIAAVLLGRGAS